MFEGAAPCPAPRAMVASKPLLIVILSHLDISASSKRAESNFINMRNSFNSGAALSAVAETMRKRLTREHPAIP